MPFHKNPLSINSRFSSSESMNFSPKKRDLIAWVNSLFDVTWVVKKCYINPLLLFNDHYFMQTYAFSIKPRNALSSITPVSHAWPCGIWAIIKDPYDIKADDNSKQNVYTDDDIIMHCLEINTLYMDDIQYKGKSSVWSPNLRPSPSHSKHPVNGYYKKY